MQVDGDKPEQHTLFSILSVSSQVMDMHLGLQIHQLVAKTIIVDLPLNNALIIWKSVTNTGI